MGEVSFVDVSKRFSMRVDDELHHVQALDRVSFTVRDGEVVALIGPSGCGKTTALRVAMGLDPANGGRVTVDGREVDLTPTEFKLLLLLAERKGRVQPRNLLLEIVWEAAPDIQTRTVDMHVQRLRAKLGEAGDLIETVRGFGYRIKNVADRL